jgi:hypothetical protein
MRTRLTIDDDTAQRLKERAHRTRKSFKQVVNEALRSGLERGPAKPRRYRLKPAPLGGVRPGFDLDKALRLSDAVEEEGIARRLEPRR